MSQRLGRLGGPVAACCCTLAAASLTFPALAVQQQKSLYTVVDLAKCSLASRHPDGNSWRCKGPGDLPLYVAEGDLRMYLSFGRDAQKRRAASQTLGPFNTIFDGNAKGKGSNRATIEWRFTLKDAKPVPYAAIVRYFVNRDGKRGQVLVVSRVGEKDACHVAYIDALANADAIAQARRIADEQARSFDCGKEPDASRAPVLN